MIHDYCVITDGVRLGEDVTVWHYTNIAGDVEIGARSVIGSHCSILGVGQPVRIGAHVRIQSMVFIPGGTVIGDNVFIAPGVVILNDKYPLAATEDWQPVTIGNGVLIGGGAIILPGVTIGNGARIGAGAVVTKDVMPGDVVTGSPARVYHDGGRWRRMAK